MDITPVPAAGRPLVESYGRGFVRISGTRYDGPVLVSTARASACAAEPSEGEIERLWRGGGDGDPPVQLLLYGGGPRLVMPPASLRIALAARNIRIEPMDTGAACRTFNVLLLEDRLVAALLVP